MSSENSNSQLVPVHWNGQGSGDFLDLGSILGIARRRKWLVLCLLSLGTVAGAALGAYHTPLFTATAEISIDPQIGMDPQEDRLPGGQLRLNPIQTEVNILMSATFVSKIVDNLDLTNNTTFMNPPEDPWFAA